MEALCVTLPSLQSKHRDPNSHSLFLHVCSGYKDDPTSWNPPRRPQLCLVFVILKVLGSLWFDPCCLQREAGSSSAAWPAASLDETGQQGWLLAATRERMAPVSLYERAYSLSSLPCSVLSRSPNLMPQFLNEKQF